MSQQVTLSAPVKPQDFPVGTVDPGFSFSVTGTLADGSTPFVAVSSGPDPSATFTLEPGTYTGVVSKLGVDSLPSDPLILTSPTTISIGVPDASAKAGLVAL